MVDPKKEMPDRTVQRRTSEEKIAQLLGSEAGAAAHANVAQDGEAMKQAEAAQAKRRDSVNKIANSMGEDAAREIATK